MKDSAMAFIKTSSIYDPEDSPKEVKHRTDYDALTSDELSVVYEDACYESCDQTSPRRMREALAALAAMDAMDAIGAQIIIKNAAAVAHQPTTTRRTRQRGAVNRSSAKSDDGDSEPRSRVAALKASQKAAAASWLAANKDWDKDLPAGHRTQGDHNYYTPANPAASEKIDYRRAVSEPIDLPPLPREKYAEKRRTSYVMYESVAPAQIPAPGDYEDARIAFMEAEAAQARREIDAERLMAEFDGPARHRKVLQRLIWGWSLAEIAEDLGLSDRRVRQIVRGNTSRGDGGIIAFLEKHHDQPGQQTPHCRAMKPAKNHLAEVRQ